MSSVLNEEPPILYELLVYEEWALDPESVKPRTSLLGRQPTFPLSPYRLINYLWGGHWPSKETINALWSQLPWQISLSPDGQLVAILQDHHLEVRADVDDFTSIVGRGAGLKDPFPQLRLLKWHPDSNKIAVSSSNGTVSIFDAFCNHLHTIHYHSEDGSEQPDKFFVAGIEFIEMEKREKRIDEVVIIYSNGLLKSFLLLERDSYQEVINVPLGMPQVSCAVYSSRFNIMFIAAQTKPTPKAFQDTCFSAGLSAWRMVTDKPYCKMIFPSEEEIKMYNAGGSWWKWCTFCKPQGVAVKLSISLNNQYLASLHSCSTIIIWLIPSLRMYRKWSLDEDIVVSSSSIKVDQAPVDIGWRHDERLIVSRRDGSISVHHVETFEICYGSGSELLSGVPRISSTVNFPGFVALECDTILLSPTTEESSNETENTILNTSSELIQRSIYYITDIETFQPKRKSTKVIQKVYRMIGVKSITPEELFLRKLENSEYDEALDLAEEFGLNTDEVYKKIWRTTAVSSSSIANSLSKINNTSWVLNECVQRVPESIMGAEDLFEFAFNLTSLESIFGDYVPPLEENGHEAFDFGKLDSLKREKILTRAILKNYVDKLRSYLEILGGDPDRDGTFDMAQYDRFRKLPAMESAVYFARQCNTKAIEVIFRHYTKDVTPFWLSILENFPETFLPTEYKNLLLQCDGEGNPVLWQDSSPAEKDWVQSSLFWPLMPESLEEITMSDLEPHFTFTGSVLSQWYQKRAVEIEYQSGLVGNARLFIELAIERNINGMDDLLSNFITLECMVYELELDIDASTLLNMTDSQKAIKLLEKTKYYEFPTDVITYFVPFLNRHCIEGDRRFQLYVDLLSYTSEENLLSSLNFLHHLLDGNVAMVGGPPELVTLIVECFYKYSKLDRLTESLGIVDDCIGWIHSLPHGNRDWKELLETLYEVRENIWAAQILAKYGIFIPIKHIHDVKTSSEESKMLMRKIPISVIKEHGKSRSFKEVDNCLKDLLTLQDICFYSIQIDSCYEIYASALLASRSLHFIEHSSKVLCCKKETELRCSLGFDHSVKLVLEAAETYFEAAENANDDMMDYAKACLFLIKDDHPEINREVDLIQGLRYLNEAGVNLIPVQVRRTEDRMKLINLCFEKDPKLYRKSQFIYKLGAKLRICGEDVVQRHNLLTVKLARMALADGGTSYCTEFCTDLVTNDYADGWEVVFHLLRRSRIRDPFTAKLLWCFCAVHAPSRFLNELFELRYSVKGSLSPTRVRTYSRDFSILDYSHASLANTPDSEDLDDYHLASSDSSHKLDEASDAEPIPGFCSPFFYSDQNEPQGGQLSEYRITRRTKNPKLPMYQVLQCVTDESLFLFHQSLKFKADSWIVDLKVLERFEIHLNKDTLTALGFLLNTLDPLACEEVFEKLPQVPFIYELAIYFFALCSLRGSWQDVLIPPRKALRLVNSLPNAEYKSSIQKYTKKLESLMQANSLKEKDCGVNYERFVKDDSYKNDTIFGLAMSPGKLDIALDLARKNEIPLLDIAVAHLEACYHGGEIDGFIKGQGESSEIASLLKSSSNAVINRFIVHYDFIDGKDYKKLTSFFKVILFLNGEFTIDELTPKEHVKLIKRVESTVQGLNYKDLVSKKADLLVLLKPFLLDIDGVTNCVKLSKSLPKNLKDNVSSSMLYYEYSIHQFQILTLECRSLKQYTSRFESMIPTLAKLNCEYLRKFVRSSICSPSAIDRMDYVTRRQLLNSLLHWCQDSKDSRSNIDEVVQYIQEKLELLNTLWSDDNEDVFSSPNSKKYLSEIEKCLDYEEIDDVQWIYDLRKIIVDAGEDPQLTREELLVLKQTASALVPPSVLFDELTLESKSSDEIIDDIEAVPDVDAGSNDACKLLQVRRHCEKRLANHPLPEPLHPPDDSIVDSGITSGMFSYMLYSKDPQNLGSLSSNKENMGKYDVAEAILESKPSQSFVLKKNVVDGFQSEGTDKVFLVWLTVSCEQLGLRDVGKEFLDNNVGVDDLSAYLHHHPGSAMRIIPAIVSTAMFAELTSSLVNEADMPTLRLITDALRNAGMVAEAGTLEMHIMRVPDSLKTFGSAFR